MLLLPVIGLLVAGYALGRVLRGGLASEAEPEIPGLTAGFASLPLGQTEEQAGEATPQRRPSEEVAYWSRPSYTADLTDEAVQRLIARGRAEALETRLVPVYRDALVSHLAAAEQSIRETLLLARAETDAVKARMREREPQSIILIQRKPRETDPEWPRLLEAQRRFNGDPGYVLGEIIEPPPAGPDQPWLRYYVIDYERDRALKALLDDYSRATVERNRSARRWIAETFAAKGLAMLQ